MNSKQSSFEKAPNIIPKPMDKNQTMTQLVEYMGQTCFQARALQKGAMLLKKMIDDKDTNWLGIAGAGIAGGMGGMVISLLQAGFIDVICSTGAQVYHDLHFAFELPVKAIHPQQNDDYLREMGDTRIYDIGIRQVETLEVQDDLLQQFVKDRYNSLANQQLSSWQFNYELGKWVADNAKHPERSFLATASRYHVPVFWDSLSNHSIAMNLLRTDQLGYPVMLSAQKDILHSAAIVFSSKGTGFIELGGGGPKNFIQQTSPTISQILGIEFEGADRGIQIGTAAEQEGSLSGCTFSESVTWGKYRSADEQKLVQIWAEYSLVFPLLTAFVLENCSDRLHKRLTEKMPNIVKTLKDQLKSTSQ